MKYFLVFLSLWWSVSEAAYDVTVDMPLTTGSPIACRLFVNNTEQADKPCGVPVQFPALFSGDGTYVLAYRLVKADNSVTAMSPVRTVVIFTDVTDPTEPPNAVVNCVPSPCPSYIQITITPP